MIHVILETSITKDSSPENCIDEYSIASLPYLPHVGDILRLPDEHDSYDWAYVGRKYYEVTGVLHDLRDGDDVEVFIVVKPYPHLK